ncbi:uncharacterized protein EV422DRAFT_567906 [Fimicolochytrium jonesii]|uniref:uncharacterized protein n=1 Tax=Fimicolochytrium jonesii TaxID=1396493 RepID=UPI0022FE4910|nr:uncharacterized protein EV422DRAFT_567906 [Fimicolochytrium jonesii]KAI8820484.1 hypothetical protein EV422DRAFT_567906 [Fimicolochytrium jonesii]
MSILASFLQTELLNLSSEAKRKNPEIKEAAERVLYILRALKERPNVQQADNVDYVAVELAKTDDALKPFIMSCETKNPKLVHIAVPCLQRLITHQAIPEESIGLVLRTLSDLLSSGVDMQLKILQTIIPLLTNYKSIHGSLVADALLLCFRLQETKSPIVNNTAAATVRQMITLVFDKVASENLAAGVQATPVDAPLSESGKDACMLFKDLCLLTGGESAAFLSLQSLPKTFGLELLEAVIVHHPRLFREHVELANLLKERVCPLIIKSFSDRVDFPLACRLMRVVQVILKQYHDILVMECEIFLSMFCRHLEPDHAPLWHRVLVMEVYRSICADADLLRFIFRSYDQKEHTTKVFHEMVTAIRRIIVAEKPALLLHPPHTANSDTLESIPEDQQHSLTATGAQIKLQCLDQLDKSEPPSIPETYIIYLAIQCMNRTVESQAEFTLPLLAEANTPTEHKDDVIMAIEMANASWAGTLAALSFLVTSSIDDDVFAMVIRAYQNITTVVGLLGLTSHRDAFLASLSKSCLPQGSFPESGGYDKMASPQSSYASGSQAAFRPGNAVLTDRNVLCIRALINVAQSLTTVLEDKAWYQILETLQVADKLITMGKTGKKESSSMSLISDTKDTRLRSGSIVPQTQTVVGGQENQYVTLLVSAKKLMESTSVMDERNLLEFVRALCTLARTTAAGAAQAASGSGGTTKDSMKLAEEKSFAVAKLHDVILLNIGRLMKSQDLAMWDFVIFELIDLAHSPACTGPIRTQLCLTLSDVLLAAVQVADFNDNAVELKLLGPLRKLILTEPGTTALASPTNDNEDREKASKTAWFVEVQKSGLETINKILQTSGQHLSAGWPLILEVIHAVVSSRIRKSRTKDPKPVTETETAQAAVVVEAAIPKASGLVRVAFPCLQLICTDFLSLLQPTVLHQCIEALGNFGSQTDDLNISLTAVGLLWSMSDFVLTRRQDLERVKTASPEPQEVNEQQEQPTSAPVVAVGGLAPPQSSIKRSTSACIAALKEPLSKETMDALWMLLLGHLSQLCSDPRPEVRNSANQSLFRTLSMNGAKLNLQAWEQCIWSVLFPLLERVQASSEDETARRTSVPSSDTPYSASPSTAKQWDETKVITLSGISRCLFDFLNVLVELGDGFDRAWSLFLDYIKSWCLNSSPEVSIAAVKSLRSLVQYPKNPPNGLVPDNVQGHLVKLMRVAWDVWAAIGNGIISNADENLAQASLIATGSSTPPNNSAVSKTTPSTLHGSFTQDTLTAFISLFADIYDVIKGTFGLFELRQLLNIVSNLLLYHTNPQAGATASRIRADYINDLDHPTPLQVAVLDLVVGGKLDIDSIPGAPELLLIDSIPGAPELLLTTVAGFIRLPFARRAADSARSPGPATVSDRQPAVSTPTTAAQERGFTYMAFAKKSMQHLVELFERYGRIKAVYSSGPFVDVIEALGVPMKAKYDCPNPGNKDTTPLWRYAANTCMTIIRVGLLNLNEFVADLPQDVLLGIYMKLLNTLEGTLLPTSEPLASLSPEELSADEAFDIFVLTTLESDIFHQFGQPHVPEAVLIRLVDIIGNGSRRYTSQLEAHGYNKYQDEPDGTILNGLLSTSPSQRASVATRPEAIAKIAGVPSFEQASQHALGSDVVPVRREQFAKTCLDTVFRLAADSTDGDVAIKNRIAEVVGPVLLTKCRNVIVSYAGDKRTYGQLPLPRVRDEEIIAVMQSLEALDIRPGALVRYLGEDKLHPLRSHILSGRSAHLFALYPLLCDLIEVLAKHGPPKNVDSIEDATAVIASVRSCLRRVGRELGIEVETTISQSL